jgi:hypothetical protein
MNICYNRNHTRYKEIQRYYNLPSLVIDAIILDYNKKTNTDVNTIPSVEILKKLNDGIKSILVYKDVASIEKAKYKNHPAISVTTEPAEKGKIKLTYSPKIELLDIESLKQAYIKEMDNVAKNIKEDISYSIKSSAAQKQLEQFNSENRTFSYRISPARLKKEFEAKYPLLNINVSVTGEYNRVTAEIKNNYPTRKDANLEYKLVNFLRKLGVDVKGLDSIKDAEGNPIPDAFGRAVYLKRNLRYIVEVLEKNRNADTIPEETAHVILWMMRGTYLYQKMMSEVKNTETYKQVLEDYAGIYTTELEFKEEAAVKLITASIMRQYRAGRTDLTKEQFDRLTKEINKVKSIFDKIIEYLTNLFNKFKTNTFDYTAMKILFEDTSDLITDGSNIENDLSALQVSEYSEEDLREIKNAADKIRERRIVRNSRINSKGEEEFYYSEDGVEFKTTVTRKVKGNKDINRSDLQRIHDDVNKRYGILGHQQLQKAINRAVEMREKNINIPREVVDGILIEDVAKIEMFAELLVNKYPKGSIFLTEQIIGDKEKKVAGTVDLIVIYKENGKLKRDIIDYKFTEFIKKDGKVIYDTLYKTKKEEYLNQAKEYGNILEKAYGINQEGKTRLIPINLNVKTIFKDKKPVDWEVTGIEIGNLQYNEDKKYLNPIPIEEERTGNKTIDSIIDGLIKERDKILKVPATTEEEKVKNTNRIKTLNETITNLQLTKNIDKFLNTAIYELQNMMLETNISRLAAMNSSFEFYKSINFNQYRKNIPDEHYNTIREKINRFRELIEEGKDLFEDKVKTEVKRILANENITGSDLPQADIGIWTKLFNSFSTQQHPKIQALYKLVIGSKNKTKVAIDEFNKKIESAVKKLEEYSISRGIPLKDMFNYMIKRDYKGNIILIDKYDRSIFEAIKKAREEKDYNTLKKFYNFDKEAFNKAAESNKKYWEEYFKNEPKEQKEKLVKEKVELFDKKYNAEKYSYVYLNKNSYYLRLKEDLPKSKEYETIQKTPELKEFYDLFTDFIIKSRKDLGLEYEGNFIPQIMQSFIEQLNNVGIGAISGLKDRFFNEISASYQGNYGELNTITGEIDYKIPIPYTEKLGQKASTDLGKVLSLWAMQYYNNVHMREIEDSAHLLYEALKLEKLYVTDLLGRPKKENGVYKTKSALESNTLEAFRDFMAEAIYGLNIKTDKSFTIKRKRPVYDDKGNIKRDADGNVIYEDYDFEISAFKVFNKILKYVSAKALGLNFVSASANAFGGITNALIEGAKGTFYTRSQFLHGIGAFTSGALNKDLLATLRYFDIMGDMEGFNKANNLSVSAAEKFFTYDKIYALQKGTDSLIINSILLAMLQSHGIDADGKIKHLSKLPKGSKSIKDLTEIKGDTLYIKGLTDAASNEEYLKFRRKVLEVSKTIMGVAPTYDIMLVNQYILGRALMQFRNWIPRLLSTRGGSLKYNVNTEEFEIGRYRAFKDFISDNIIKNATKTLGMIVGIGTNLDEIFENKFDLLQEENRNFLITKMGGDINNPEDIKRAKEAYVSLMKGNVKASIMELQALLSVFALVVLVKGGDDDDEELDGFRKFTIKTVTRFKDELAFFVNPISFNAIVKSPFAVTATLTDVVNFTAHFTGNTVGVLVGSEEMQKKYKPIKYIGKLFPVTSEAVRNITIWSGEEYWK